MSIFRDCSSGLAETLSSVTIGIAGAGGIGSNAAMLLVRAGASSIVVADFDSVEPWNLNRQFFFADQAGKPKVEALRENLLRINGDVCVEAHRMCLTPGNACGIFEKCDILIEAVDNSATKAFLIEEWSSVFPGKPIVACSGIAGNSTVQRDKNGKNRDSVGCGRSPFITFAGNLFCKGYGRSIIHDNGSLYYPVRWKVFSVQRLPAKGNNSCVRRRTGAINRFSRKNGRRRSKGSCRFAEGS
jgi:sulfur carrier protein ThiS adenylyltransferase